MPFLPLHPCFLSPVLLNTLWTRRQTLIHSPHSHVIPIHRIVTIDALFFAHRRRGKWEPVPVLRYRLLDLIDRLVGYRWIGTSCKAARSTRDNCQEKPFFFFFMAVDGFLCPDFWRSLNCSSWDGMFDCDWRGTCFCNSKVSKHASQWVFFFLTLIWQPLLSFPNSYVIFFHLSFHGLFHPGVRPYSLPPSLLSSSVPQPSKIQFLQVRIYIPSLSVFHLSSPPTPVSPLFCLPSSLLHYFSSQDFYFYFYFVIFTQNLSSFPPLTPPMFIIV